jgi:myo-inositol catabolism protein IolS
MEAQFSNRCRIVAVQNKYDMLAGEYAPFEGVIDYCAANRLSFVPYSQLQGGLLTDRYVSERQPDDNDRLVFEKKLDVLLTAPVKKKLLALSDCARNFGIELSQLALAYPIARYNLGPIIPFCRTVGQLEQNAAVNRITLTAEQIGVVQTILRPHAQ